MSDLRGLLIPIEINKIAITLERKEFLWSTIETLTIITDERQNILYERFRKHLTVCIPMYPPHNCDRSNALMKPQTVKLIFWKIWCLWKRSRYEKAAEMWEDLRYTSMSSEISKTNLKLGIRQLFQNGDFIVPKKFRVFGGLRLILKTGV